MFNSLQPSRPKLLHHQPPPPTNQQGQRRTSSTLSSLLPQHPPNSTSYTYQPPRPRNQIEAMPPVPVQQPALRNPILAPQQMVPDASKRHPVFFTDRLKKAPMGVTTGGGAWSSPVADGYIFNDGARRGGEGDVKL
ncbi:uncharacterized protein RSE6_16123 [Rhynchosporium secalis]|uniref:Uncharacterized protein n=1 Tax=Rhynchosporium secalis TaxID=38038 RepID=A0A1E1MR77_RHYSE|nr:uncharacterized protein RSE6_16123 [Rhynchosporium secalis]